MTSIYKKEKEWSPEVRKAIGTLEGDIVGYKREIASLEQRIERMKQKPETSIDHLRRLVAMPIPNDNYECGSPEFFDPWSLFPALYGSYGGDFDKCAIEVLSEILAGKKTRDDLGAEMFREMLCNADLCDYGTSPRVCFATQEFKELIPVLIEMWRAYSMAVWGEDVLSE